jgi:hypothetical protein
MIKKSASWSFSVEVSLQSQPKHLQPYQEFFEDLDNINIVPNHEVELVEFEHREIGYVYHDPVVVYMEEFFFSEYPLIPKVSGIVHRPRVLCCKDHVGNQYVLPVQVLFLILIENIEREELLEKLLHWLHWHYYII